MQRLPWAPRSVQFSGCVGFRGADFGRTAQTTLFSPTCHRASGPKHVLVGRPGAWRVAGGETLHVSAPAYTLWGQPFSPQPRKLLLFAKPWSLPRTCRFQHETCSFSHPRPRGPGRPKRYRLQAKLIVFANFGFVMSVSEICPTCAGRRGVFGMRGLPSSRPRHRSQRLVPEARSFPRPKLVASRSRLIDEAWPSWAPDGSGTSELHNSRSRTFVLNRQQPSSHTLAHASGAPQARIFPLRTLRLFSRRLRLRKKQILRKRKAGSPASLARLYARARGGFTQLRRGITDIILGSCKGGRRPSDSIERPAGPVLGSWEGSNEIGNSAITEIMTEQTVRSSGGGGPPGSSSCCRNQICIHSEQSAALQSSRGTVYDTQRCHTLTNFPGYLLLTLSYLPVRW